MNPPILGNTTEGNRAAGHPQREILERDAPEKADTATPTGPTHSPSPKQLASLAQKLQGSVWGFLEKKKEKD